MTKLFSILATVAFLAVYTSAIPAQSHPPMAAAKHIQPNVAQAKHHEYTIVEARQYHNADYGSNQGPTGNPHPEEAQPTASAPASDKAQATEPTATNAQRDVRRAVGTETEPRPTHGHAVDYTQYP